MTREARMFSGIILITVPTIQYGGYFLLTSLMDKTSGYMDNPLRQNFFRAGHAHAGVIVILSLVMPGVGGRRAPSSFVIVDLTLALYFHAQSVPVLTVGRLTIVIDHGIS